jgi:hypothetical protein
MNTLNTPNYQPISKEETTVLTQVVAETIAINKSNGITAGELWRIQKQHRTAGSRRTFA